MLHHLSIRNYALIESLELDLNHGFSVITGETGAGKSVILGALGLVLGKRADLQSLKDPEQKCVIEGIFQLNAENFQEYFEARGLEFDTETIIRREIYPSGKSRAFINDSPTTLNELSELAVHLIDVHSQHSSLLLSDKVYQIQMLDSYADNVQERANYKKAFEEYKELEKQLANLKKANKVDATDMDYLKFLLSELEEANIVVGEQASLEEELQLLENAEEIQRSISEITTLGNGGETDGAIGNLRQMCIATKGLAKFHPKYKALHERLQSLKIELDDIVKEVAQEQSDELFDSNLQSKLDTRLSLILNLQKKHNVATDEELLQKKEEIDEKIQAFEGIEESLTRIEKEIVRALDHLKDTAHTLSLTRRKTAPVIANEIISLLKVLNIPSASFEVVVDSNDVYASHGNDSITFMFTANKGVKAQALSKVASGGEMSRVMLALKAIMARKNNLPTIIFDEIDSGVSGETAGLIGQILKEMGTGMQVIAISHLPQIAAMGASHFKVEKYIKNENTVTSIYKLDDTERLHEVARMLSGEQVTTAAMENAKSLLYS